MAAMAPAGGRLWNDFPADGLKGGRPGHGGGGGGSHRSGKMGKKGHKNSGKKHGATHGKKPGSGKHGMKEYHKPGPGTSRKRSAAHHSAAAQRMAQR